MPGVGVAELAVRRHRVSLQYRCPQLTGSLFGTGQQGGCDSPSPVTLSHHETRHGPHLRVVDGFGDRRTAEPGVLGPGGEGGPPDRGVSVVGENPELVPLGQIGFEQFPVRLIVLVLELGVGLAIPHAPAPRPSAVRPEQFLQVGETVGGRLNTVRHGPEATDGVTGASGLPSVTADHVSLLEAAW